MENRQKVKNVKVFSDIETLEARRHLNRLIKDIDAHIENFFPKILNENDLCRFLRRKKSGYVGKDINAKSIISAPVWALMKRRGRHWRSLFAILLLEALGKKAAPYEQLLSVIPELCHSGALIIDDIEDNSLERRGNACIHKGYGLDVAINAANTVYFLPFLLVANHKHLNERKKFMIYRVMVDKFIRAHFGQGMDIYFSKHITMNKLRLWSKDSLEDKITQVYADKTSAILEGLVEIVEIISGLKGSRIIKKGIAFANKFGVAFQIIDDVHNFIDQARSPKKTGEDLRAGKLTYVIASALNKLTGSDQKLVMNVIARRNYRRRAKKILNAVKLIKECGVLDECLNKARLMVKVEREKFFKALPRGKAQKMLLVLLDDLL
ncbi:MAG: polyprenyl synthetase family protein [Candidatus Omnitrophica bacterium]|nr:polyprenyl synthetase family protein [Candidatus Omnitrophota bacterium]